MLKQRDQIRFEAPEIIGSRADLVKWFKDLTKDWENHDSRVDDWIFHVSLTITPFNHNVDGKI